MIVPIRSACRNPWTLLLGVAIVVAMYWSGLYGGFFFDDHPNILEVEGVRLASFSLDSIQRALASGTTGVLGRPISQLSFAINYYFSGYDPFAFKLTNLVIHCLNCILAFLVALHIFAETQSERVSRNACLLGGIIAFAWAIHPIQITSVLYVVQRMTSLSAMFLLTAFLLHIHVRQENVWQKRGLLLLLLAWAVFWPLSILSKETGVLFPVFIAAYELIIRRSAQNGLDSVGRTILFLTIAAIAVFPFCFSMPAIQSYLGGYEYRSFSLVERLLTEARVIWEYLGLIVAPRQGAFGLFHDDIPISTGLMTPWTTLPAILGLISLVGAAFWARSRFPLIAFGIAWFLLGHSLESTFLPLEIAHEHRNYLPLFGICLLPIGALAHLTENAGERRTLAIALCSAFVGYCGLVTYLRANMFGDDGLRTQIETSYHPDSARSNFEAGRYLSKSFDTDRDNQIAYSLAKKHYALATELDPAFKMGLLGLIHLECATKTVADEKVVAELAHRLAKTLFAPGDATLMFSLQSMTIAGKLCLQRSDIDTLFASALANPRVSSNIRMLLHSWHADYLWLHQQDMVAARKALSSALALSPSNPSNRLKMAQLVYISGELEQSLKMLLELRSEKLQPEEQNTLNELLTALGKDKQGN